MNEKRHNGWTNFETWVVALWLGNDVKTYAHWKGQLHDCFQEASQSTRVRSGSFTLCEQAAILLADRLHHALGRGTPSRIIGLYADLLQSAISEVDCYEIAKHLLEDVTELASEAERSREEGGTRQ